MKNKVVSVIVLAYNVGKYIEKCILSILEQEYADIEVIIVVNGRSSDDTENIVRHYAQKDNRIKLVYNAQNSIIGKGRLLGLEAVSGEYFTFVDGDDFLEPNGIRDLIHSMHASSGDIVIGSLQQINTAGDLIRSSNTLGYKEYTTDEYFPHCLWFLDILLHGKLYKTGLREKIQARLIERCFVGEDKILHLQLTINAKKVVRIPSVVHNFRHNPTSITNNLHYGYFRESFLSLTRLGETVFKEKGYFLNQEFSDAFRSVQLIDLYYCLFLGNTRIFRDAGETVGFLLYGNHIKKKEIRRYLKQWRLFVPVLELYRANKHLGAAVCKVLNEGRKIRNRYFR